MKLIALSTLAAVAATSAIPARAGFYVNVETNGSSVGSDFQSRTTETHIGYEGNIGQLGWYLQGGPAFLGTDAADGTTELSGKIGGTVQATEKLGIYGELAVQSNETTDTVYGSKLGAKWSF
tara:strand:- start:5557 stop:5922 length:366 start_codon:yes stop_codon:yes gene_type:complete